MVNSRPLIIVILLLNLTIEITGICQAGVLHVPGDNATIQDAINASRNGDTIIVRDGIYSVYLNITKSLTLRSENGTANCILEASTNDDIIEVHAGLCKHNRIYTKERAG
ncbi:MAG: hypothetical protein H0Z19_01185 [Archaeoglobus sp.]|uniref:hypothetical protein n=1 Tax=Archaeoglobus sp. TaxID=1872626 RepID=UPI001D1F0496|nr:hypothetical protein [Archaeoglobus sp.]MBO8179088.1 hypothetical protein [Archaeoglobus sp.]